MRLSIPNISTENQQKVVRGVLIVGGLYMGYRLARKGIRKVRSRNTSMLVDQRPEVRQAMGIRSALNPSGISWLMWGDGTNEKAIEQLATQIKSLDVVTTAYRNLYGKELIKDLQNELSVDRFNSFLRAVSNNRINTASGRNGSTYTATGKLVAAKQNVLVRTTPDGSYHGAWYEMGENKNIFRFAKAGEFIGYATGKQHYDAPNNIKYIEVAFRVGPGAPRELLSKQGQVVLLWVSASAHYTIQFTSKEALLQHYPGASTQLSYMLPPEGLGWLASPGQRVVSQVPTQLLSEQFTPYDQVESGMLLGYPVMSLEGTGAHMTLVRTAGGTDLWVPTTNILIT